MLDYRVLPKPGAQIGEDLARGAGWSYDPLVSTRPFSFLHFAHGLDVSPSFRPQLETRVHLLRHPECRRYQSSLHSGPGTWRSDVLGAGRRTFPPPSFPHFLLLLSPSPFFLSGLPYPSPADLISGSFSPPGPPPFRRPRRPRSCTHRHVPDGRARSERDELPRLQGEQVG